MTRGLGGSRPSDDLALVDPRASPDSPPSADVIHPAVDIQGISHWYGERLALDRLDLTVPVGEIFGLLGPNGGGKTTLFRLLSTAIPLQSGQVRLFGDDLAREPRSIRARLGVVFQHPALDKKLTVQENLRCHAAFHNVPVRGLDRRIAEVLDRLGVLDRRKRRVETLSGGLSRRVEIAKCLLHEPEILLLDEPSAGLDPGARLEMWKCLRALPERGVTVLLTTHLLDEAERCDRIAILDQGRRVALGSPARLREEIGGDVVTVVSDDPGTLLARLRERGIEASAFDTSVRFEHPRPLELLPVLKDWDAGGTRSITIGKPTLEDFFIRRTGHPFGSQARVDR